MDSPFPNYVLGKALTVPTAEGLTLAAVYEQVLFNGSAKPQLTGLAALLEPLPLSSGKPSDVCLRLPGKTRQGVSGYLSYWGKRWHRKFRCQYTNQGVRIWRTL